MEHANGTAIGSQNTNGAINTAAHEFFHLWNVKRIRPQTLEPVDYSKEMPTRALWFAEGVTSTYGCLHAGAHRICGRSNSFTAISADKSRSSNRGPRASVAKRGRIQPRCMARKISHLQRRGFQRELLQQGPARWSDARRADSRRDRQSQKPRRRDARDEREFRQARTASTTTAPTSKPPRKKLREFPSKIFRKICRRHGRNSVRRNSWQSGNESHQQRNSASRSRHGY